MKLLVHSQTSTAAQLKFGNGMKFHPIPYDGCNYLSLLGLNLICAIKRVQNTVLPKKYGPNLHVVTDQKDLVTMPSSHLNHRVR